MKRTPPPGAVFICGAEDFHPYECPGEGQCMHCDRLLNSFHDPAKCALCDPAYDGKPNPAWGAR